MANVPLGKADYHRTVPKEARVQTRNRFFEQNPVLNDQLAALISRPGLHYGLPVGEGPIRATYSEPGSFDDAQFVVSGTEWYRVELDKTVTLLTAGLNPGGGAISMAATGTIGDTPEYMFMADGRNLWLYMENGYARGTLTGAPANNDVVRVGSTYYQFTNASVDAGAPAGTAGNPWKVKLGITPALSLEALGQALNGTGTAGTAYSTALVANTEAQSVTTTATQLYARATAVGIAGNGVVTTETGAGLAWSGGTMANGGDPSVTTVETPDDVAPVSLGYIASYVVVIPAQGEGINGRFWWIEPGEITIDPLNFATAERAPDPIFQVVVFQDQFWLPGSNTTEVWYFTGNFDSPVLRLQGVTFDRGTWEGTAVQVKESMVIVDSDGGVFQISGGLKRISNPSIEQRIREAIQRQAALGY